jgi:hydroxymethylglutaryl-CoA lyase
VDPLRVAGIVGRVLADGADRVAFGDTTGMATPRRVRDVIDAVRSALPDLELNMHFHDTRGTGLANVVTALELGVDYFDASVGGMGGSPYAAGATGNITTEDLVHMLSDMEIETGIDLDKLIDAAKIAQTFIKGELPSKMLKAGHRLN